MGIISCFIIAPAERGRGLARRLMETACEGFEALGLRWVEAYPRKAAESAAAAYHGPLSMYLDAGFERVGENERLVVVRRALAG